MASLVSRAPCVSIILPTFNRLKYLPATIDSIRRQTFEDWELVIADDGSGQELRSYLQSVADPPRIKVLWLEHTGNPPAVRNAALLAAEGEYIAFLDSDDIWLPKKLELQVQSLRHNRTRPWSYTAFTLVDESGNALSARRAPQAAQGLIFEQLIKQNAVLVQSSVVVRRDVLMRAGSYDIELPICGDYELWLRLAREYEIECINQPLVQVRRHGDHYADDIDALQDLARALGKVQSATRVRHLHAALQRRRAKVSGQLARRHAVCGCRLGVFRTIIADARIYWSDPSWWLAAMFATGRVLAPAACIDLARRCRKGAGGRTEI